MRRLYDSERGADADERLVLAKVGRALAFVDRNRVKNALPTPKGG